MKNKTKQCYKMTRIYEDINMNKTEWLCDKIER